MFTQDNALQVIVIIALSYLMGSFPTAYLIAKAKNINIFERGSGSMGGTNMVRVVGWRWGVFTGVFDVFKGVVAVLIARDLIMPESQGAATSIAAICVIAGHNWSLLATLLTATVQNGRIRATFRGGKGAATAFGTMLMIAPFQMLVAMVVAIYVILRTKYVSLGVLIGYTIVILWLFVLVGTGEQPGEMILFACVLAVMLAIRFRGNIYRLRTGTERRLGEAA